MPIFCRQEAGQKPKWQIGSCGQNAATGKKVSCSQKGNTAPMFPRVKVITHYNILGWSLWLPNREAVNRQWCVLNLTVVSGGDHLSHPVTLTRFSQHGPVFDWNPDCVDATFPTSIIRCLAAIWRKLSNRHNTQQPISCYCFSFTSDIKAEGLHSPVFLSVYHGNLAFSLLTLIIDI